MSSVIKISELIVLQPTPTLPETLRFMVSNSTSSNSVTLSGIFTKPAISEFINANHTHNNPAGGGQLDSTLALSDTSNIAYLNTANTYGNGKKQIFNPDNLFAGINIGQIDGDPTLSNLVNGDMWYVTIGDQFVGRINGTSDIFTFRSRTQILLNKTMPDNEGNDVDAGVISGTLPVNHGGTGVTTSTGADNVVLSNTPTLVDAILVTPLLGTPVSGTMTNVSGTSLITGLGAQSQTLNMDKQDIDNVQDLIMDNTEFHKLKMERLEELTDDTPIGEISFRSVDGAISLEDFASIVGVMESRTNNAEHGSLKLQVADSGAFKTDYITLNDAQSKKIKLFKDTTIDLDSTTIAQGIQITQEQKTNSVIKIVAPILSLRRANRSLASNDVIPMRTNDLLGSMIFSGNTASNTTTVNYEKTASIVVKASDDWSPTRFPTSLTISTTPELENSPEANIIIKNRVISFEKNDIDNVKDLTLDNTARHLINIERNEFLDPDTTIGEIRFKSFDGNGALDDYTDIKAVMESKTIGAENGSLQFRVADSGAFKIKYITLNDASSGTIELLKDTNVLGTLTPSTYGGSWNGNTITVPRGGTGRIVLADHSVLIGNGTGNVALATIGAAGTVLKSGGTGVDPTFATISIKAVTPTTLTDKQTGTPANEIFGLFTAPQTKLEGFTFSGTETDPSVNFQVTVPPNTINASNAILRVYFITRVFEAGAAKTVSFGLNANSVPSGLALTGPITAISEVTVTKLDVAEGVETIDIPISSLSIASNELLHGILFRKNGLSGSSADIVTVVALVLISDVSLI